MPLGLALIFILAAVARFIPHPANFAPVGALGIFAALYFKPRQAVFGPLAARLLTDVLIGFFSWPVMVAVYLSTFISSLLGLKAIKKKPTTIVAASLIGSVVFFLLTNLAVWAFGDMYPKTISGLVSCFTLALPFFRNSVIGDLFYLGAFIAVYEISLVLLGKKQSSLTTIVSTQKI